MFGLILETSTEKGCIVLSDKEHPLAFRTLSGGPELSKTVALETEQLVKETFFPKPDFIAVGTGPGSYTGTRVGVSLAKALAFGWNIPLFGFCSLQAFFPTDNIPCTVVFDARMGGFYILDDPLAKPILLPFAEAQDSLPRQSRIASPHPEMIHKRLSLAAACIETNPSPSLLASIGYQLALEGKVVPLELAYLQAT